MLHLAQAILRKLGLQTQRDDGAPTADDVADIAAAVTHTLLPRESDRQRFAAAVAAPPAEALTDGMLLTSAEEADAGAAFTRLRWGGQVVVVSRQARALAAARARFGQRPEFRVEVEPQALGAGGRDATGRYAFVARKVLLTRPDTDTDRYSYDVRLVPSRDAAEGYDVLKQVPTFERTMERLASRFPEQPEEQIARGARKLVNKVFPLFLTREAAILRLLERDLPGAYRHRFPKLVGLERDSRGLVQRLQLSWLRLGGAPLSQMEFARQSLELLHTLHERAHIIHLDLRLDNLSVTPRGVAFLDFGSSVRVGEDLSRNPMLSTLFHELLSTSQIQRDLKRLIHKGRVTSRHFVDCYHRIDKAVDLFYLVLQMNNPHINPDFRGLVRYDRAGDEAARLASLSRRIFKPRDAARDRYRTAVDVLSALSAA